jgi:hypothetical protein
VKTFKFLSNNDDYVLSLPHVRRMAGRTIAQDLVQVQPLGPPDNDFHILRNSLYGALRTRECAVIASSMGDFNNWRNETFDRNSIFIITNRDFTHLNGNNNQTTRYRAISRIDDCYGLTFDDYITTDRIEDILSSVFDDTIDSIRELIVEVNLHTRDNETI